MDLRPEPTKAYDFEAEVARHRLDLGPLPLETLQLNVTKLCNQACRHCHVDASPKRTEQMDRRTADRCLELLAKNPGLKNLDLTGGAPELNPEFARLVLEATRLGRHVMVRHNLTVTLDGNPQTREKLEHLPEFFARHRVEVISSLPYYQEFFTDKQRGSGVFKKSIESLKRLNTLGYGRTGTGLLLNLVYNPVGPYLPPPQVNLEKDYKRELEDNFGVVFNGLFTITNMPIHRFAEQLRKAGTYGEYMDKLLASFNPAAAKGVMCRNLISVGHDGAIYDCDFNQMLGMQVGAPHGQPLTIFDPRLDDLATLGRRKIRFDSHCFGCTAGAGSSCGGALID